MVKLDENKIRWIIKSKDKTIKNSDIADIFKTTPRRVQQIYLQYKTTKKIPILKTLGWPRKPIISQEIELVKQTQKKYHANALYLEKYILKLHNTKINHNRIHKIMLDEGLSVEQPRKKMRRKWIRYKREYSNSLWHTDWHTIHDSRWDGKQLITFEDGALNLDEMETSSDAYHSKKITNEILVDPRHSMEKSPMNLLRNNFWKKDKFQDLMKIIIYIKKL